ncbi:ATP-binding protein [Acetobacter orientalis]|uniref:ATP-binding protein n=1 Tax=Acetobacter orientalis TaxID=146474 RepID=A0A252BHB2_9PROT|nr:BolA family transcriptional regulator [Acetobacter orientalis]OUJ03803.1 ATP-binding protein [Acetobacter orientalis]
MAMSVSELENYLQVAFPDAQIKITDLAGDGDHYSCTITSNAFKGLTRVKQHQLVYQALQGHMGGKLHALALQTSAP